MKRKCYACKKVINGAITGSTTLFTENGERRDYHPRCLPIPKREYKIQGLPLTREMRALGALVARAKKHAVIIKHTEMENVEGMMFNFPLGGIRIDVTLRSEGGK